MLAIIWTEADLLSVKPISVNLNQNATIFVHENAFENTVCKMGLDIYK